MLYMRERSWKGTSNKDNLIPEIYAAKHLYSTTFYFSIIIRYVLEILPVPLQFLSLIGPGPCVAADPRHNRINMFR